MILKSSYQINYTILPAGTQLEIIEQSKAWHSLQMQQSFLFEVKTGENKGFKFWSCIGNLKYSFNWYKPAPAHIRLSFVNDYIEAGWNAERIVKAGLLPKEHASLLPQYIKHFAKIKNAQNF